MEITQALVCALIFIILPLISFLLNGGAKNKLPPGPRPLPIIGNLHNLGKLPHRALANMARKYGPLMSIRLGQVPCIVISSAETAKIFLKQHDTIFASRPALQAVKYLWYEGKAVGLAPYGERWRKVRRMVTLQFLTATKVEMFEWLRKKEIERFIKGFMEASEKGEVVNVGSKIKELTENIMFKMMVGKSKEEDKRYDLQYGVQEVLKLGGEFNIADYVPLLAPLDLQGLNRKMKKLSKEVDDTLEAIIDDHINVKELEHNKDLLRLMLDIMQNPTDIVLDRETIKAIMLDLFGAGIDTIGHTIEWAIAAMIKDQRVLNRLQQEIDSVVGKSRPVEESDFPKLPYLDMMVMETLRLYPGAPLLLPRESVEDVVIDGYKIPKKSRLIVNFWAIARDPSIWGKNVDEFYPERFENGIIGLGGQHFEYIPFGSGRRICPGALLGTVTVKIVVARMVQSFDWKLPPNEKPEDMDMMERFGISIPRVAKLFLIPSYRL